MAKTEQEKQAEATARQRLLSFDCGVESAVRAMGLSKQAAVEFSGAKDFREFAAWTLNAAAAMAEQAEKQNAQPKK